MLDPLGRGAGGEAGSAADEGRTQQEHSEGKGLSREWEGASDVWLEACERNRFFVNPWIKLATSVRAFSDWKRAQTVGAKDSTCKKGSETSSHAVGDAFRQDLRGSEGSPRKAYALLCGPSEPGGSQWVFCRISHCTRQGLHL